MAAVMKKVVWVGALGIVIGAFAGLIDAGIAFFSNPSLGRGTGLPLYFSRVIGYYDLFWLLLVLVYGIVLLIVFQVQALRNSIFSNFSGHIVSAGVVLQVYIDSVNSINNRLSAASFLEIGAVNILYLAFMALFYLAVYFLFRTLATRFCKPRTATLFKKTVGMIALILGVNLLSAVAEGPERLAARSRRITLKEHNKGSNIVLITIDSLRPDHLSCYGDTTVKTANIDSLAEQGLVFTNAMSNAPWTYPSLASLFTSLYPDALNNCLLAPIPGQASLLAEIVSATGVKTASIVSNPYITSSLGLTRGFEYTWNSYEPYFLYRFSSTNLNIFLSRILRRVYQNEGAAAITGRAIRWLSKEKKKRFFLWMHYIDLHHPYGKTWNDMLSSPKAVEPESDAKVGSPPSNLRLMEYLYDQDLLYTDRSLGELFKFLRENGLWDNSAIILTADHGEEFFEHGHIGHNANLDWGAIHVPLIIKMPAAVRSGFVRDPVELVDLYPTILELIGIPSRADIQGKSLLPMVRGEPTHKVDFSYSSCNRFQSHQLGLSDSHYTLIYYPGEKKFQLFDRVKDPWEQKDIAGVEPELAQKMLAALRKKRRANIGLYLKFYPRRKMQPKVRLDQRALRGLGYVK